jgi:hypothetical protein
MVVRRIKVKPSSMVPPEKKTTCSESGDGSDQAAADNTRGMTTAKLRIRKNLDLLIFFLLFGLSQAKKLKKLII